MRPAGRDSPSIGRGFAPALDFRGHFPTSVRIVEYGESHLGRGLRSAFKLRLNRNVRLTALDAAASNDFDAGGFYGRAAEARDDLVGDDFRQFAGAHERPRVVEVARDRIQREPHVDDAVLVARDFDDARVDAQATDGFWKAIVVSEDEHLASPSTPTRARGPGRRPATDPSTGPGRR